MCPIELIAPLARIAGAMPGAGLVDELVRLEALAAAIARGCPVAERHFHEDYCGRSILIVDLPPGPGPAASLVVMPAGPGRFDLARMADDTLLPIASSLAAETVVTQVLAECAAAPD